MAGRFGQSVWLLRTASRTSATSVQLQYRLCSSSTAAEEVRVRYAPSPTGSLHLGGLRTALYNYLLAKKHQGKFLLRIEDTDQTRLVPGATEALSRVLRQCGVDYDEGPDVPGPVGPYIQSQRLPIYRKHAEELLEKGHAYRCFCSSERLDQLRQAQAARGAPSLYDRTCMHLSPEEVKTRVERGDPHTIRLKVPTGSTTHEDVVWGTVKFPHSAVDDQVLMKSDGFPTYHLAAVVDDHSMRISHVIRGQEWLSSTPKHLILYECFGWKPPKFAHLPLLVDKNKNKLSKRSGDVSAEAFVNKGYLPEALINFIALLGWNPGTTTEVFNKSELIQAFSLEAINKSNSVVDMDRLGWINNQHIKRMATTDLNQLALTAAPFIQAHLDALPGFDAAVSVAAPANAERLGAAVQLQHERVTLLGDFGPLCAFFFHAPDFGSTAVQQLVSAHCDASKIASVLGSVKSHMEELPEWHRDPIADLLKKISKQQAVGMKQVLMPVRLALTGMDVGAHISDIAQVLGKPETLKRISAALARV